MPYYMVLNDGETYTELQGCKIVALTDEAAKAVEWGDLDIVVTAVADFDIESLSENGGEPVDPARVGHVVTTF